MVNLVFNFALIPEWGISGAAFATLMGYLANFVITYFFSEKLYPCDYDLKHVAPCAVVLYAGTLAASQATIIVKILVMVAGLLFVVLVFRKMVHKALTLILSRIRNQ